MQVWRILIKNVVHVKREKQSVFTEYSIYFYQIFQTLSVPAPKIQSKFKQNKLFKNIEAVERKSSA